MPWILPVITAATGIYQAVSSSAKEKKAERKAEELSKTRPKIGIDPNAESNLSLVKSELANGVSAKAERAYNDIVDRQFSSSLSSLLKGGGDVNSIGDIYGNSEEGRQKLSLMMDNLRLNQIKNVIDQSQRTDERNTVTPWQVNLDAPWKDAASATSLSRQQAAKGVNDGINTIGSSAMQYFNQMAEIEKLKLRNP